jgi:asparagine synthase (glutamine-hydrolysing)
MTRRFAGSFDPRVGTLELACDASAGATGPPLCLFDGWLDNAEALRSELAAEGERQVGGSDEELLAAAFRRWGADLPGRMRGDFALLVWDSERRQGLLARDQLGVRPLFLHKVGERLRFAVELRDLLDLLPTTPAPDRAAVAHWIALSTRPGTGTLYEGVERLGPGEMLSFDPEGVELRRYWAPRFREPLTLPETQLVERVRGTLRGAVERRRDPGRQTGVLMSGGLDSASIAAVAGESVRVYSATFPGHPETDEAEPIAELRRALGLRGVVAEVRPGGLLASVLEHLTAWRAPLIGWGDFWALPLLRTAAERGVGTMLGGDGGDELFAPRVYALADELQSGHPSRVLELARRLPGAGAHISRREEARMIARLAFAGAAPPWPAGRRRPQWRAPEQRWLTRRTLAELRRSDDPDAWKRLDGPRWWANAAHGLAYGIEATGVFEHQRRRAEMAGLEARHPMLDLDLVELCLRQPPERTLDPRFSRPTLRAAMEGLLPDSVRLSPRKARFESLVVACLTGPDADAVRAILTSRGAELGAYVKRRKMVDALFGNGRTARADPFGWMWQVWRLLNAELWLQGQGAGFRSISGNLGTSSARVEILDG